MGITHKFIDYNWQNGFFTKSAILHTPFKPEVIFIGTFNHGWDWNIADFFYGRDMYMWPILANLFLYNRNKLINPRNEGNNNPSLAEIFEICHKGKIVFADLVRGTKNNIQVRTFDRKLVLNNSYIWDNYSDKHINSLGLNNWLEDNVAPIVDYIKGTPSIKHIYFTFKSEKWLIEMRDIIISNTKTESAGSIFTPTGMGFRKNLDGYNNRAASITHCWVWNGLKHSTPVNKPGYSNLDHHWLTASGVEIDNF